MKKHLFIFLFFLSACSATQGIYSVFDNNTCKLPCWNGIVVGETTYDDALEIIQTDLEFYSGSLNFGEKNILIFTEFISFNIENGSNDVNITLAIDKGLVQSIGFRGDLGVSIQKVIDYSDEPEFVNPYQNMSGELAILFASLEGTAYGFEIEGETKEIEESTELSYILFFVEDIFYELLESGHLTYGAYSDSRDDIFPWNGYGMITDVYGINIE